MKWLPAACVACAAACSAPASPSPSVPAVPPPSPADAALAPDAALADATVASAPTGEVWLRGNTHVHALPSGDSREPVESVVRWYETHGYDFIALTDHNRVTEPPSSSRLIVLPAIELTHNRKGCEPPGDESGNCRIHVNALGVTARPEGKLAWIDYKDTDRVVLYEKAFATAHELGASVIQINHPQYYWGMTADVMVAIGRSAQLVEVANAQFAKWNAGDATHLSTEALWDAALAQGLSLWGVASDDAHHYGAEGGKYPPGGGWVMVKARRDPASILAALAAGRFYASTGVTLSRAEREGDELVVEVVPDAEHQYAIAFVENGKLVATVNGPNARRAVPRSGYVRAVVTKDDGSKAWVQPVRW